MLECIEHVALSEDYLFSQILAAKSADAPLVNAQREAQIVARGTDRSRPAVAPEMVRPRGAFSGLPEAVQHFQASRARTIQFVKDNSQEDLRSRLTSFPPFGTINCHETLLLIAAHPLRHAMQIAEIKAALADCWINRDPSR